MTSANYDDGFLPSYETRDSSGSSSPVYSPLPSPSELVLDHSPMSRPSTPPPAIRETRSWTYHTKHMSINLGENKWGFIQHPAYGHAGTIEGDVTFEGKAGTFDLVTVTLEGAFYSSQRSAKSALCILSESVTLFDNSLGSTHAQWDGPHRFSIPIPDQVSLDGRTTPTPPSFSCYNFAATCEISYSLKFHMSKKGIPLVARKHESKIIPILYLPKSSPVDPPLSRIPRPSRSDIRNETMAYLQSIKRVETHAMTPVWPLGVKALPGVELEEFQSTVNFSLPSPMCFASGSSIPFTVGLSFPSQPCVTKLLSRCIRVVLFKRIVMCGPPAKSKDGAPAERTADAYREWPIATGELKFLNEYTEGLALLRGFLDAGEAGKECSWRLGETAEGTYGIRAWLTPPKNMQSHIPIFKFETQVDIKTDAWGSLEREVVSTGVSMPALGLMSPAAVEDVGPYCYYNAGL